jgi:hypothetical protein
MKIGDRPHFPLAARGDSLLGKWGLSPIFQAGMNLRATPLLQ